MFQIKFSKMKVKQKWGTKCIGGTFSKGKRCIEGALKPKKWIKIKKIRKV